MSRAALHRFAARILGRPLISLSAMADTARRERLLRELKAHGDNIALRPGVEITHPERVSFGNNIMLNHGTMIFAGGGVTIGDDVVVGPGCLILTGNHRGEKFYGSTDLQPISIGSNVWLGARAVITPGTTIGSDVIVSAGSVVTGDVPDGSIFGGVPAKKIRDLELPFEPRRREEYDQPDNEPEAS